MDNVTYDKFPAETFQDITFKKVIFFPSRDGGGMDADIYFKGKLAAKIHDDGNGGMVDLEPAFDTKKKVRTTAVFYDLVNYVKEKNLAKVLHDNGWNFMELERIEPTEVLDAMISAWDAQKKIVKLQRDSIVFSEPNTGQVYKIKLNYPVEKYPQVQLKEYVKKLRDKYPNDIIINTNLGFDYTKL